MGTPYATVSDITALGIDLTAQQRQMAEKLLAAASSKLRIIAARYGKDIDAAIADESSGEDYAEVVKNTVIQSVLRGLNSLSDTSPVVSQVSQSALGYSASTTYINAGQSLWFQKNELKELGILQQTYGFKEMYFNADDTGNGG